MDCRAFEPSDAIDELLVIQPLSARKVVKFLSANGGGAEDQLRSSLRDAIDDAELYELAALPWLLLHMLGQVKRVLPRPRAMVLEGGVGTALDSAAADGGGADGRGGRQLVVRVRSPWGSVTQSRAAKGSAGRPRDGF